MYEKPLPRIDSTNAPYWEACRVGRLLLPRCTRCHHTWFPPSSHCPACLSFGIEWAQASGRGRLWSWNVFHQAYMKGFREELPYLTALIQLEEGPFMTSTIVDADPADLRCDLPVEVVFEQVTDEVTLPKFRLAADATHRPDDKETSHAL